MPGEPRLRAHVITVSDRSAAGERPDRSGPRAAEALTAAGYEVSLSVVADGAAPVEKELRAVLDAGARLVVTSGGTGVGPRDRTPEGTRAVVERELPGVAEQLRRRGAQSSPYAVLSRGVVGVAGTALVVNLPGSPSAVVEGLEVVLPVVPHILDQLSGGDH